MSLVYLDMIKLAVPTRVRGCEPDAKAQYVMFGTYDMLHYELPGEHDDLSLTWMERRHEDRHNLDWNYERHPVHLYVPDDCLTHTRSVLNEADRKTCPLVLTMARVDKRLLVNTSLSLDQVLGALQCNVDDIARRCQKPIDVVVCWNLGNADFLFLSRCTRVADCMDLLMELNKSNPRIKQHAESGDSAAADELVIEFKTFSSYCAFPKGEGATYVVKEDLNTWLNADDDLEFIDFVDSVAVPSAIYNRFHESKLLLGDRDYQLFCSMDPDDRAAPVISIVNEMLELQSEDEALVYSSSLIPSLPVKSARQNIPDANQTDATTIQEPEAGESPKEIEARWKELESVWSDIKGRLLEACKYVKANPEISRELASDYISEIDHCINTLEALYKYALRLYAAAYQDDVHAVIHVLYASLAQILKDSIANVHNLRKRDEAQELARIVPMLYVEIMRFVSELQHVYTVLAISPHSHMETYYGSMRSLNASSKLWTSYNGVVGAITKLFPTKNQEEDQDCRALLVPYREKPSHSSRIVPDLYSESILLLIQINYQMMFDARSTLFVIAHELGHYIFNNTRARRTGLMLYAVLATLFNDEFADMLECPLYTMTNLPRTRGNQASIEMIANYRALCSKVIDGASSPEELRRALCLYLLCDLDSDKGKALYQSMTEQLKRGYMCAIKDSLQSVRREFVSAYAYEAKRQDDQSCQGLKYHYGEDIKDFIFGFCEARLARFFRRAYCGIAQVNYDFLRDIDKLENAHKVSFDRAQIVKLRTYWSEECTGVLSASGLPVWPGALMRACGAALELFREVHAEIFASKVTKWRLDDYLRHVASFAGFSPELLDSKNNVQRIMVLCETIFGDAGCSELLRWLDSDEDCPFGRESRQSAMRTIRATLTSPYYPYLKEYGKVVAASIDDRVQIIEQDTHDAALLRDVRDFARGDASVPCYMWQFWLRVMRDAR